MTRRTRRGEKEKGRRGALEFSLLLFLAIVATACGANEDVLRSGKGSPTPPVVEAKADPFEKDLADVKSANFTQLYVIRRKDGGILDGDDKAAIKANTTDANRRIVSDGGRAVIVGSNYDVSKVGIDVLKPRFDVTDLSMTGQASPTPSTPLKGN